MIHRITSSLPGFKELRFTPGLNILLAKKELGATDKQTRNRAGKSSLIEIIHFVCGGDAGPKSLFAAPEIADATFGLEMDLGPEKIFVHRSVARKSKVQVTSSAFPIPRSESVGDWKSFLGEVMFRLPAAGTKSRAPSFRSLFPYFVRRESEAAFLTPEKHSKDQQIGDLQIALLYLLGFDWQIAADWKDVRDRERTLTEFRKAAGSTSFGRIVGKAAELRTQWIVKDARWKEIRAQLAKFRVLAQYRELEEEADHLTHQINDLANANVVDIAALNDLEHAVQSEAPPPISNLEAIYAEAGIALPGLALRRFEDVRSFHESVIRNRRNYLAEELSETKSRIANREQRQAALDERRGEVLRLLQSHGALDQFSKLQGESSRLGAEVEGLRNRMEAAEQLENAKTELEIEKGRLEIRLGRDFDEQSTRMKEAVLAFEETSGRLYESQGSINIDKSSNGPKFSFPMQGARSKGVKNILVFCFDMMLMRLCAQHGTGPGFLVHDSHLFDGVDGRQIVSALNLGAETAEELGFQYIVTMNEDDAFKERFDGFDMGRYVLDTVLTDSTEDGGLFGFRF